MRSPSTFDRRVILPAFCSCSCGSLSSKQRLGSSATLRVKSSSISTRSPSSSSPTTRTSVSPTSTTRTLTSPSSATRPLTSSLTRTTSQQQSRTPTTSLKRPRSHPRGAPGRWARATSVALLVAAVVLSSPISPASAWPGPAALGTLSRHLSNRLSGSGPWITESFMDGVARLARLGGLLGTPVRSDNSSGKVLNFFPIPVSDECLSSDGRRTGICLNTYECRIQNGKSYGPCALGFGVCCVFTASCGDVIENNVTYFVSPNFPEITREASSCELEVKKIARDISQLRLDFVHFSMGQPNRRTGICESDTFVIGAGTSREFSVCGQNSGQHFYFDVEDMNEPITIMMNMSREHTNRLWEIKVTQIEFRHRAPAGCLQYHQSPTGVIQTMNFAENGRHLANQDYTICMRQEDRMCSIVYEPCDENSFKIGPAVQQLADDGGSGEGAIGEAREQCQDKIVMPCDSEEFIAADGPNLPGPSALCDLLHCGNSFCNAGEFPCRIESSTTPFNIHVMFGPAVREESPEDNLGMCLKYEQQPCGS